MSVAFRGMVASPSACAPERAPDGQAKKAQRVLNTIEPDWLWSARAEARRRDVCSHQRHAYAFEVETTRSWICRGGGRRPRARTGLRPPYQEGCASRERCPSLAPPWDSIQGPGFARVCRQLARCRLGINRRSQPALSAHRPEFDGSVERSPCLDRGMNAAFHWDPRRSP